MLEGEVEKVKRPAAAGNQNDNWTTTSPHNRLYILHRWHLMSQSHTWFDSFSILTSKTQCKVRWSISSMHSVYKLYVEFDRFSPIGRGSIPESSYHSCVATIQLYNELTHVCEVVHALCYLVVMAKRVTSFNGLGTRVWAQIRKYTIVYTYCTGGI